MVEIENIFADRKGKKQQALQEEEMKSYLFNLNAIFNI